MNHAWRNSLDFLSLRERTEVRVLVSHVNMITGVRASRAAKATLILTFSLREKEFFFPLERSG
jgi:hypothetical protein